MADATVRIEGLARLRRTLREAGDDLADLKRAHLAAASVVAAQAAATAPRVTGRLAATLKPRGLAGRASVAAGTRLRVPYAPPIHWGWERRGIAANPFVSKAAQDTESVWLPIYMGALDDVVDKVKGV